MPKHIFYTIDKYIRGSEIYHQLSFFQQKRAWKVQKYVSWRKNGHLRKKKLKNNYVWTYSRIGGNTVLGVYPSWETGLNQTTKESLGRRCNRYWEMRSLWVPRRREETEIYPATGVCLNPIMYLDGLDSFTKSPLQPDRSTAGLPTYLLLCWKSFVVTQAKSGPPFLWVPTIIMEV